MGTGSSSSMQSSRDQNAGFVTSIMKFIKPGCLWTDEKIEQRQPLNEVKVRTLKEWLLASPSLNNNCSNGGEYYVYESLSPRVHVCQSLYVDQADCMFNSLEELPKLDEVEQEERSRSKTKKRVRFRLPEEADIVIFYSPAKEEFEES